MLVKEQELLIRRVESLSNKNSELYEQLSDKKHEIRQLQEEVRGWKEATNRNAIQGFALGALIFFWAGYLAAWFIGR